MTMYKNTGKSLLATLLVLSLFNSMPCANGQVEAKPSQDGSETTEVKPEESEANQTKTAEPEKTAEPSKTISSLKQAFINFDINTAFGVIPRMIITVSKKKVELPPVVIEEPVPEPESEAEQKTKEENAKENAKKVAKAKDSKKKKVSKSKNKSENQDEENPEKTEEERLAEEKAKQEKLLAEQRQKKNNTLARCFVYAGYSFLLDSNPEAAKNCFSTALSLNPSSLVAKCYLVETLKYLALYEEQDKLIADLNKLENKPSVVYEQLATEKLRRNDGKAALALIEEGLSKETEKNSIGLLILKARAYANLGLGKLTTKTYEEAAEKTENPYVKEILLANASLLNADLKGTKKHILNASKILPDDPIWQYKLGNFYAGENESTKAIEYLLSSIVTNRLSAKAYVSLAQQYSYDGKFENALNAIHHIQKLLPNMASLYATEGDIYKRYGKPQNSLEAYDETIKKNPYLSRNYFELAYLYTLAKRKDEALKIYDKALELMPNFWRLRFNYAEILWKLKMYPEAKEQCLKGLTLLAAPNDELNILASHYSSRAHAMLCAYYYGEKDLKNAIGEAVKFNEQKYLPKLPQALSYVKLRPERIVFASDLSMNDPLVLTALADALYEVKDYKESEKQYRKAIELSPEDADLHSYLLNVLTHEKDWVAAAKENFAYSGKLVNKIPGQIGEWLSPSKK